MSGRARMRARVCMCACLSALYACVRVCGWVWGWYHEPAKQCLIIFHQCEPTMRQGSRREELGSVKRARPSEGGPSRAGCEDCTPRGIIACGGRSSLHICLCFQVVNGGAPLVSEIAAAARELRRVEGNGTLLRVPFTSLFEYLRVRPPQHVYPCCHELGSSTYPCCPEVGSSTCPSCLS